MKIIAIDPGDKQSAVVVWDGRVIHDSFILDNETISIWLSDKRNYSPTYMPVVCEMIASYGMAVGETVFETCVWIGRFWDRAGSAFHRIKRKDVKMHLCGSMRAKDSNIRQALIDRFGSPGTRANPGLTYGLKKDLWAAFAVAVTWHDLNCK